MHSNLGLILVVLIVLCLVGGFGSRMGGWGGAYNRQYGYGGMGLGGVLLFVLIVLLLTGGL